LWWIGVVGGGGYGGQGVPRPIVEEFVMEVAFEHNLGDFGEVLVNDLIMLW
jgi:hypothetical protein